MLLTLLCIAVIVIALYYRRVYTRFSRYGVKHFTPIPPFGNMTKVFFKMEHLVESIEQDYRCFPGERFVGRYQFTDRQLVIRDLELIKKITMKDSEYFLDHYINIDSDCDPILGRILLFLKGQEWKDMRSNLSPAFTSYKIRLMVPFMVEIGEQMIKALNKRSQESKLGYIDVDVKDMTTRLTTDVIASFAFGLNVDSYKEVDNSFYANVKTVSTIKFKHLLKFFGFILVPKLMKVLKVSQFSDSSNNFFRHLVMSTMQDREKRNIMRHDMIHLLMNVKKGRFNNEDNTTKDVDPGFVTVEESNIGKKDINRGDHKFHCRLKFSKHRQRVS